MAYYVYENWTAEHKAVIHKGLADTAKKEKDVIRTHLEIRMANGMALLPHLKKPRKQQKIPVDLFESTVDKLKDESRTPNKSLQRMANSPR